MKVLCSRRDLKTEVLQFFLILLLALRHRGGSLAIDTHDLSRECTYSRTRKRSWTANRLELWDLGLGFKQGAEPSASHYGGGFSWPPTDFLRRFRCHFGASRSRESTFLGRFTRPLSPKSQVTWGQSVQSQPLRAWKLVLITPMGS